MTTMLKVIKTEEEHQAALARLGELMSAPPGSPEEDELELLAVLIERYEQEHFPIDLPDPIEAILFCMDQQGLTRRDLVKYIGSQSKVSEVLNRKRALSPAMMRALHTGLGIPAAVLLQEPGKTLQPPTFSVKDFPVTEMFNCGYFHNFNGTLSEAKQNAEGLLVDLLAVLSQRSTQLSFCRNSDQVVNENALRAWQAHVLRLAAHKNLPAYTPEKVTPDLLREVVHLSYYSQGPQMAVELLERNSIALVFLPHLSHTYLDGAAFHDSAGRPVIGMTLRHDRLDNFWFTLVHELAHVYLHLNQDGVDFFDDTERGVARPCDPQEVEANQMARGLLIPGDVWEQEKGELFSSMREEDVSELAEQWHISPAVVAGRMRWELNDYSILTGLLGHKILKKMFMTAHNE